MDLINQLEQRKFLITGFVLTVAFATLVSASSSQQYGWDPFWHLQMARDWFENGLSPWVDHYSYTYNGHEITNPPVVFQGLLYFATSLFGLDTGFQVFRFCCFALTMAAVLILLRQIKAPAVVYALVVPMVVLLLQMRALVRPELLSYTFSVVALALYFRAGDRISARNLVPMLALMWAWSAYHSSIVGYVIFFGFFLDCALAQLRSRQPVDVWVRWFSWGILILAVGFLNPGFSHPLIEAVTFPPEWKILIREYWPLTLNPKAVVGTYVLALAALLTPVLAFRQRRFGFIVICVVLAYSALSMRRMVTPAGIVMVLLFAYLLVNGGLSRGTRVRSRVYRERLIWLTASVAVGLTLYSNVEGARYFISEKQDFLGRYPVAIADYMQEQKLSGRIFNDYAVGGYLIYRLSHQNQVYIDGRTQILYPVEHMRRHQSLIKSMNPDFLREELDRYAIDHILWKHSQTSHDLVEEVGGFGLDFMDASYVLYTRGTSNFPLHGKLLARPECWHPAMLEELKLERKRMDEILPGYLGLVRFSDLVVGYSGADDGRAFIDDAFDEKTWLDEMRRFAGFRLLENEEYDPVVGLFGGVQVRKPADYLAPALAMIKSGELEIVSNIFAEFSAAKWPHLRSDEVFIYFKLYQMLGKYSGLTPVEQGRLNRLQKQLAEKGYSGLEVGRALGERPFCVKLDDQSGTSFSPAAMRQAPRVISAQ